MTETVAAIIAATVFGMFSLSAVVIDAYLRDRLVANVPIDLARRQADADIFRVFEPRQRNETWFGALLLRIYRGFMTYVRCKRRTLAGRLDLYIVIAFLSAVIVSWPDVCLFALEMLKEWLSSTSS